MPFAPFPTYQCGHRRASLVSSTGISRRIFHPWSSTPTSPRPPFGPILLSAATALRAHAHIDGERWARALDELAVRTTLPTTATPAVLDLLAGFELARVPEVAADALRPGFGGSVSDLAELFRMRNAMLAAAAVLLDALHGELPAAARVN